MSKKVSLITKTGLLMLTLAAAGWVSAETLPPLPPVPTVPTANVINKDKNQRETIKNVRLAATSTRENVRNEIKQIIASTTDKIRELRDEKKAQVEAKIQEIKTKYQENRKARIAAYVEKIINRHNAAINRLTELADRIEARIAKLETNKINTSDAKVRLAAARTKILAAAEATTKIQPAADTALQATDLKVAFETVKQTISDSSDALKTAHVALVDAINSLKPGVDKLSKPSASRRRCATNQSRTNVGCCAA